MEQPAYVLTVEGDPRPYRIGGRGLRVGREPGGDVVLADTQASRRHLFVWVQDGQVYLRDEDSTNGTWIGERRVTGVEPIGPGEVIRVGSTHLRVGVGPAPASGPQASLDVLVAAGVVVLLVVGGIAVLSRSGPQPRAGVPVAATTLPATQADARRAPTAAAVTGASTATTAHAPPPSSQGQDLLRAAQEATVLLIVPLGSSDEASFGSGSIVDSSGLILTNFHVAGDVETGQVYNPAGRALVAVTRLSDGAAELRYQARLEEWDAGLDVAVLRIDADADGNPLRVPLALPVVRPGDSGALQFAERIYILGYPGVGGASLTVTVGSVSGFVVEGGRRTWIKTDAEISRGNSGGLAVNEQGELIGIPTWGNLDVEAGETLGKLGYIRPISWVLPLIERAR